MRILKNRVIKNFFLGNLFLVFLFLPLFILTNQVRAQVSFPSSDGGFSEILRPNFPGSYEETTITISSLLYNLNKSFIVWSLNGVVQSESVGKKSFSFKTGALGSKSVVSVNITTTDGSLLNKTFSIIPAEVDIFWEADSYTPPFYKGKGLPSLEGSVRVIAFPKIVVGGSLENSSRVSYTWYVDNRVFGTRSLLGNSEVEIDVPLLRDRVMVRVEAESFDGSVRGESTTVIKIGRPQILFYKYSPLLGPRFETSLKNSSVGQKNDFGIVATPYYVSKKDLFGRSVEFVWKSSGKTISAGNFFSGRKLFLQNNNNEGGLFNIAVSMRNLKKTFQSGTKSISVRFEKN